MQFATPQEAQAFIDADPEVQAILRRQGKGAKMYEKVRDVGRALDRRGVKMPKGYSLNTGSGQVIEDHMWRNVGLTAAGAFGSAVGLNAAATRAPNAQATPTGGDLETPGTVNAPQGSAPSGGRGLGPVASQLTNAAFTGLAGLPALFSNRGVSDQETAYTEQAQRLLAQQEQRTQYQNPLYEAATRMAFSLLPQQGNGGNPYPYAGLSDTNAPGLDALRNAQRR